MGFYEQLAGQPNMPLTGMALRRSLPIDVCPQLVSRVIRDMRPDGNGFISRRGFHSFLFARRDVNAQPSLLKTLREMSITICSHLGLSCIPARSSRAQASSNVSMHGLTISDSTLH